MVSTEIGVVIHRRIRMWYYVFHLTYTPPFTLSLILVERSSLEQSERG